MWLRFLVTVLVVLWVARHLLRIQRALLARRTAAAPSPPWDPYAVLGIASGATPDEITRAYRDQMKRYHPDRVADLPLEFQELAHHKAIEIQRAYVELGGRR